ncbi:PilW family protein [Lautropia mirabilis]|uniref:PilW family protein n=1 Tax=Lautropia mirabilis TaxID=47671 RepID=UPI0028894737|nr:PilW family protein [Lautropia mirabilis]
MNSTNGTMPRQPRPLAWHPPGGHARQQGFSMIEMLISVAIGLMVTATVLYTVSGSGISGRKQNVQSTIHDLGNLALVQLADHLRMTGFWLPSSEVMSEDISMHHDSPLFGCSGPFADPAADWNSLACGNGSQNGNNDSVALRFQVQPGGRNWDCLGNVVFSQKMHDASLTAAPLVASTLHGPQAHAISEEIEERLYIKTSGTVSGNPGLFCRSNITPTDVRIPREQILADNVEQMRIRYGVSGINPNALATNVAFDAPALSGRTSVYRDASQMVAGCQPGAIQPNAWCAVNAVRICLVMRSEDNVNDQVGTPYVDCDGVVRTVQDRRLRQAFTTTVAIRNKVGVAQ